MRKIIKFISLLLLTTLLILVVGFIALVTLINPNDFKNKISEEVFTKTGRELTINGDITWTFFPNLGLKINNVTLSNNPKFSLTNFAKVGEADISISTMALVSRQLVVNKLILKDLNLDLMRNVNGESNWQDLFVIFAGTPNTATAQPQKLTSQTKTFKADIANITISNSKVNWQDLRVGQNTSITDFNFNSSNINLNSPFSFQTSFSFRNNLPKFAGQINSNGTAQFDLIKNTLHLSPLKINGTLQNGTAIPFNLKTDIATNFNTQNLRIDNLSGKISDSTVNGNFEFTGWSVQTLKLNGTTQIDALTIGKFHLDKIQLSVSAENSLIKFSPIRAALYQGSLRGNATLDLKEAVPKIATNLFADNIAIQPLLNDLADVNKIAGTAQLEVNIGTSGNDENTLLRNLNGTGNFKLANGIWHGINIAYQIDLANALINNKPKPLEMPPETKFGNWQGTFKITNGILSNDDLLMQNDKFQANGNGTVNLVDQTLNYNLTARGMEATKPMDFTIPIKITGSLMNPSILPDLTNLTINIVKQTAGKEITKQLQRTFNIDQKTATKVLNSLPIDKLFHH